MFSSKSPKNTDAPSRSQHFDCPQTKRSDTFLGAIHY